MARGEMGGALPSARRGWGGRRARGSSVGAMGQGGGQGGRDECGQFG